MARENEAASHPDMKKDIDGYINVAGFKIIVANFLSRTSP